MNLDKYRVVEDSYNFSLEKYRESKEKPDGSMSQPGWVNIGYYNTSAQGRVQVYNKLINLGVSELEEQTMENILTVVGDVSDKILDWYAGQVV